MANTGEVKEISIFEMMNGAAVERANYELAKVIRNCMDLNAEAKKPRKLTVEFTFVPSEARDSMSVKVESKSKPVPIKAIDGTLLLGGTAEDPVVMEYTPQIPGQRDIAGGEQDEPKMIKLADIKRA